MPIIPSAAYIGSWAKPLNWNLHVTPNHEPRVPFRFHVQPDQAHPSHRTFHLFCTLPAELQLHILSFCSIPTLWQLMRASPTTRAEAAKHFWSDPDSWYCVHSSWLLTGGFPGQAHYALDFLNYVQQVKVDFNFADDVQVLNQEDLEDEQRRDNTFIAPPGLVESKVCTFWQTLQHRCPRVKHVVLSDSMPRRPTQPLPTNFWNLIEMCPASIRASASTFRFVGDMVHEDRLWQQAVGGNSAAGKWEELPSTWTRQCVLVPPKEFRGPVGAYQRICYKDRNCYVPQKIASRLLLNQAIERHHFVGRHEPFDCFYPRCTFQCTLPGKWTQHFWQRRHAYRATIPDEYKAPFEEHRKRLERILHTEINSQLTYMRMAWGKEGSEERRHAEQAFLYQLEHDPLYAQGTRTRESTLWLRYNIAMNSDNKW